MALIQLAGTPATIAKLGYFSKQGLLYSTMVSQLLLPKGPQDYLLSDHLYLELLRKTIDDREELLVWRTF